MELTRIQIENKIKGIKLKITKLKKKYASEHRGLELKLTEENITPLQNELIELSNLWGNSKY